MENNISLVETSEIEDKIQIILRQTNYTEEIAIQKLKENNFDEIATIKSYLGISRQKKNEIKSVNQEIYKQLRRRLDSNIRDYKVRVENGEAKIV